MAEQTRVQIILNKPAMIGGKVRHKDYCMVNGVLAENCTIGGLEKAMIRGDCIIRVIEEKKPEQPQAQALKK